MKTLILIIEDDQDIRNSLQDILEMEGYEVLTAENGEEGLQKFYTAKPQLVILDLYMPVMNGLEFLERIQKDMTGVTIPVLLCTAAHPSHDEFEKASSLAQGTILKPLQLIDMLSSIRRYCPEEA